MKRCFSPGWPREGAWAWGGNRCGSGKGLGEGRCRQARKAWVGLVEGVISGWERVGVGDSFRCLMKPLALDGRWGNGQRVAAVDLCRVWMGDGQQWHALGGCDQVKRWKSRLAVLEALIGPGAVLAVRRLALSGLVDWRMDGVGKCSESRCIGEQP